MNISTALFIAAIDIILVYFLKNLIDFALKKNTEKLLIIIISAIIIIFLRILINYIKTNSSGRFIYPVIKELRIKFIRHIEKIDCNFFFRNHSGDIISRNNNDITKIQNFLKKIPTLIILPMRFLSAFIYMLFINWQLLFITIIAMPLAILFISILTKPLAKYQKELHDLDGQINSISKEAISEVKVIKAYNTQRFLSNKYNKFLEKLLKKNFQIFRRNLYLTPIYLFLNTVPRILCIIYGGFLATKGIITPGSLAAYMQLISYLIKPINSFFKTITQIKQVSGILQRLTEVFNYPIEDYKGINIIQNKNYECITFQNVIFSYDKKNEILSNINISIDNGDSVAIVGPSGSGKSTILKLICRFFKCQKGKIYFYGNDINQCNIAFLRTLISYVPQNTTLFPLSISENIACGISSKTQKEIIEAAKFANAHEFIMKLPDKYETNIGEHGHKISGGERQRITLARAILKNTPILLMDEPTSALDNKSEVIIQKSLKEYIKKRTLIIVAHKLSSIRFVDKIFVIQNGKVCETGTHDELINQNSVYKQLYMDQIREKSWSND